MIDATSLPVIVQTLKEPLCARYIEGKRFPFLFQDKKLEEIGKSFGCQAQKVLPSIRYFVTIKTLWFDKQIQKFINKHPDGIVLNIGCGMDSRYFRLNNTRKIIWYDIDLPETIKIKSSFIKETASYILVGKSILDDSWTEQIVKNKPTLCIAETVLMYFPEEEVKWILQLLHKKFPEGELLIDVVDTFVVKHSAENPQLKSVGLSFLWGIKESSTITRWVKGLQILKEWRMRDIIRIYSLQSFFYALFVYLGDKNKTRIVHFKFT